MSLWYVFLLAVALGAAILYIDFRRWRQSRRRNQSSGREASTAPHPRPQVTDALAAYLLSDDRVRYACGHDYPTRFGHDFYGERLEVSEAYADKREQCGDCMLAEIKPLIIRCCACGAVIMPSEPVAAYADDGSFRKEWSTATPDGKSVLGCMRMDCCPSGGFFAGHWSTRGFVPAFAGQASLAAMVFATGKPVAVSVSGGKAQVTVLDDGKEKKDDGTPDD